jgi:hypothetical protein
MHSSILYCQMKSGGLINEIYKVMNTLKF